MIPRLHILMPCVHPERLPVIISSYTTAMEKHCWELRIHILLQGPDPDPKGVLKVNEALDEIRGEGGWLMMPSDDTIQYPALFRRLGEELEKNPDAVAMVVGQERRDGLGNLWASPDQMRISRVCGGSVCWNREWLKSERMEFEKWGMFSDGEFISRMFARAPHRFVFIPEMLVRFNSMEWV